MASGEIQVKEVRNDSYSVVAEKPDLFISLVIWQFVAGSLWFIGLVAALLFAYPFSPGYEANEFTIIDMFTMIVGTFVLFGAFSIAMASGFGLIKRKMWTRNITIISTILSLVLVPFGPIAGTMSLFYLMKREVKTYFRDI